MPVYLLSYLLVATVCLAAAVYFGRKWSERFSPFYPIALAAILPENSPLDLDLRVRAVAASPLGMDKGRASQPVPASQSALKKNGEAAERRPEKILLVEDNPVNQKVELLMLSHLGYQADAASDGLEALRMVRERAEQPCGAYDVVFMDIHMPKMDGEEATRRIRAELQPQFQPVIIALTADTLDANRARLLAAGMDAFLSKPILKADLAAILAGHTSKGCEREGEKQAPALAGDLFSRWEQTLRSEAALDAVIGLYLEDAPQQIEALDSGIKAGDWRQARQAAHALKSSSAALGAAGLAKLLAEIETISQNLAAGSAEIDLDALKKQACRVESIYRQVALELTSRRASYAARNSAPPSEGV